MMLMASATTLRVGEAVTVTVVLSNEGDLALGLPQYWLNVGHPEAKSILNPNQPEAVVHHLAVPPGQSDTAAFVLRAVQPGQATVTASASFEVHLSYPGPAYWGGSHSKEPLLLTVEPQ